MCDEGLRGHPLMTSWSYGEGIVDFHNSNNALGIKKHDFEEKGSKIVTSLMSET